MAVLQKMNDQNYDLNEFKPTASNLGKIKEMEKIKDEIAQTKTLMQLKNQANIIKTSNNQVQTVIENINSESRKFQVIVMVIIVVIIVTQSFISFQAAYQYPQAKFKCKINGKFEFCKEEEACKLSPDNREIKAPLDTYTQHFELWCDRSNWKEWALVSFWGIGGTLNLIMMQFVDKIGRKSAMIISTIISLICAIITVLPIDNFWFKVALMAISFGAADNVFT